MFRFSSTNPITHQSLQRHKKHLYNFCSDYKRYALIFVFLFVIPTFYFVSNSPSDHLLDLTDKQTICPTLIEILSNANKTLCSSQAARRGPNQRIISLSIFGPKENKIFVDDNFHRLMNPFLAEAKSLFPSWIIRLYADESAIHRLNLMNLTKSATNIDICNVNELPILGNVGEYLSGKLWRFLPALDPTVEIVSSRDLDSPLIEREVAVIEQFIKSKYIFLSLRDHPLHLIEILGGLWSAYISRDRSLFVRLFSVLLDKTKVQRYTLAKDQLFLKEIVWPYVKNRTLAFDSYTCGKYGAKDERPFPTQRITRECHLGCVRPCCEKGSKNIVFKSPCPVKCRPKDHQDWLYC